MESHCEELTITLLHSFVVR